MKNEAFPPLTVLRAFDAAARDMSFAQATAELNVTPAALSFPLKSIWFRRLNRAAKLTEADRALAPRLFGFARNHPRSSYASLRA